MSTFFKKLFRYYINSSIHVALSVYSLLLSFIHKHNLDYQEALVYTIFYGSITAYNFVKYAPIAKLYHRRLTKNLKVIQIFSLVSFLALVYYSFLLPLRTNGVLICGLLLILAYTIPFVKNKNLRSLGKTKIYIVAFCWVISCVVAPYIHYKQTINWGLFLKSLQVFILIIALIIPFDIRDLKYDSSNLKTIPQLIGVQKAKFIAVSLLVLFCGLDFLLYGKIAGTSSAICIIIWGSLILRMSKNTNDYYCSFGIESFTIVYLILLKTINF